MKKAMPTKPTINPTITFRLEEYCFHRLRSKIRNNNGSVATKTAAYPLLIYCSAQTTRPDPPNNISIPLIDNVLISDGVGSLIFLTNHDTNNNAPDMTKRY